MMMTLTSDEFWINRDYFLIYSLIYNFIYQRFERESIALIMSEQEGEQTQVLSSFQG